MSHSKNINGLNPIQIGLLRMFDRNIPNEDIIEIKDVLVHHLNNQLLEEVDKVIVEKKITDADFVELEKKHFRSKV